MTLDPRIVWRFAQLAEMRGCCPDDAAGWLGPNERRALAGLRDANRRDGWLLARVLAKQLILEHGGALICRPEQIQIVSRDAFGRGIRPQVTIAGRAMPWSLSISHTDARALAALSTAPEVSVGVDVVRGEPVAPGFVRAWFDGAEQALVAAGDGLEACRVWAVKEAVYKAANQNDPFSPRQIPVRQAPRGGYQCTYRGVDLAGRCRIETRVCGDHVAALATVNQEAVPRAPIVPAPEPINA